MTTLATLTTTTTNPAALTPGRTVRLRSLTGQLIGLTPVGARVGVVLLIDDMTVRVDPLPGDEPLETT